MNKKSLKNLEYYKIIEKVASFASSSFGKEQALKLYPSSDINQIKIWQKETSEAVSMTLKKGTLKIGGLRNIEPYLKRVNIGGSLNMEELLNVADFLSSCKIAKDYSKAENKNDIFQTLEPKFNIVEPIEILDREITRCIISHTEMSDDASNELREIRKNIKNTNENIKVELNKILQQQKNILQESVITVRGDRYCIPIKSEYKNSFSGMIHDQSATGATVFIEPASVVQLNNKIKDLRANEIQEINKILKKLSEKVYENKDILLSNLKILVEIDVIFAKANYSISINGTEPILNQKGYINIKKARHPLLEQDKVVATDIYLGKDFTTLLITGPNTGGKTVSLKTIGLFTLMAQTGLHISAFDKSEIAIFDNVFSDIGDEQSIEQSLSTFSAHMKNIIEILNEVTDNSLVLLDELGAGTDPTEGACLAIAIIKYLHDRKIRTAVTTHYSELKVFAISTEGVSNACCEFDVQTLRPTYRLLIGIPGKSNAFAISKKLGLPEFIINDAKELLSQEDESLENIITDLEISQKSLMIEKERAESYRQEAQKLKNDVENQKRKTKEQKEKILFKATEDAKRIIAQAKIEADNIVKEIQKLAKEKANQNDINEQRNKLKEKLNKLDERLEKFNNKSNKKLEVPKNLKKGDRVFVHSMNQSGTVTSEPNSKGEVGINIGIINMKTNIKDLSIDNNYTPPKEEKIKPKKFATNIRNNKTRNTSMEIDLRGLYLEEAIEKVDKFIDDAYIAGIDIINIIHGKGTGALRTGIHEFLRRHSKIKSYRLGEFGEGDAGVTVAQLK